MLVVPEQLVAEPAFVAERLAVHAVAVVEPGAAVVEPDVAVAVERDLRLPVDSAVGFAPDAVAAVERAPPLHLVAVDLEHGLPAGSALQRGCCLAD